MRRTAIVRVLDTSTVPAGERESAFTNIMSPRERPLRVEYDQSDGPFGATVDTWSLTGSMLLMHVVDTGTRMVRSPRELRYAPAERMAINVRNRGVGSFTLRRNTYEVGPGSLMMNDHTSPSEAVLAGGGEWTSLVMDYSVLDVRVDHVRRAAASLPNSPMSGMFLSHLAQLTSVADDFPEDDAAQAILSGSTIDLARVLISTAAGLDKAARDALRDTEVARMAIYIRQHLRDQDLSAAKIAQANHISLRQLYKVWSTREMTLGEHIMAGRLRGASRDLTKAEMEHLTIAEVGASWGFVSAAHFSKRFRAAYGVGPQEWRRQSGRATDRRAER